MEFRDLLFVTVGVLIGIPAGWAAGLKAYQRNPEFWHRMWGSPRERH